MISTLGLDRWPVFFPLACHFLRLDSILACGTLHANGISFPFLFPFSGMFVASFKHPLP